MDLPLLLSGLVGTLLNAAAILIGGIYGLTGRREPAAATQQFLKAVLGLLLVWVGLSLTWVNLSGGVWQVGKQLLIVVVSMTLGRLIGRALRLQKSLNRLGQYARERLAQPRQAARDGLVTCAILFCATPISVLGALFDGLEGRWHTLGIKAVMDGFAAISFGRLFRGSALLAVIPLLASQGTLSLVARLAAPFLNQHELAAAVGATGGLLIFCVSLLIFNVRKVELADYLPSLLVAPLVTWFWR